MRTMMIPAQVLHDEHEVWLGQRLDDVEAHGEVTLVDLH